jgi:DNA-binding NarL/FixJ family response regulator
MCLICAHPNEPPEPTRILLIDEHRMFNDDIKSLLDEQPDLSVFRQVFSATDVRVLMLTM